MVLWANKFERHGKLNRYFFIYSVAFQFATMNLQEVNCFFKTYLPAEPKSSGSNSGDWCSLGTHFGEL